MYIGQLIWNREFNWRDWKVLRDLEELKRSLISIRDSGDGARVKSVRILDDNGNVIWNA